MESVKAVSDLYSPVTGTVTEVNEQLATAPEKINSDAHTAWILKVDIADLAEIDELLDAAAYENVCPGRDSLTHRTETQRTRE